MKKYLLHNKIFSIKNNHNLKLFEDLIKKSDAEFDCSIKIEENKKHPVRFVLYYPKKNITRSINLIFNFFNNISKNQSININYEILKKVFEKNINPKEINNVYMGIDFHENHDSSRIKLYFLFNNKSDKINNFLNMFDENKDLLYLLNSKNFEFGVDFYLNGKTKAKIYIHYNKNDLKNIFIQKKLKSFFSDKTYNLIKLCKSFYISLNNTNNKKTIFLVSSNTKKLLKLIKNNELQQINKKLIDNNILIRTIGLRENEINTDKIKNINIYY